MIQLSKLKSNERNPRFLRDVAFKTLCSSIVSFPAMLSTRPIVVNSDMVALGGNMRQHCLKHIAGLRLEQIQAMYHTGISEQRRLTNDIIWAAVIASFSIPKEWVKVADFATPEEEREFIVKDNLQSGEWEMDMLAADYDLTELDDWGLDIIWENEDGMSSEGENEGKGNAGAGKAHPVTAGEEVEVPSYVGDIFIKHGDIIEIKANDSLYRIGCLDSTNETEIGVLMGDRVADMVFQDPPYNVSIKKMIGANKSLISSHEEFTMAAGEMSEEEFTEFLFTVFSINVKFSKDGSIHYQCMDWKHILEILNAAKRAYHNPNFGSFLHSFKNMCVWNKDLAGMGAFYRSKHELVFVFKKCEKQYVKHTNNFMLGQPLEFEEGRYRTNVWDYNQINSFSNQEDKNNIVQSEGKMHPTVKPLQMVIDAILDCSNPSELITDYFCGSGTTLCAGLKSGRSVFTCDISPKYVQTALKRAYEQMTIDNVEFQCTINNEPFTAFSTL